MTNLVFKNGYSYEQKILQMRKDTAYDIGFDSDAQNAGLEAAGKIVCKGKAMTSHTVSYTHLTLPTIYSV